MISLVDGVPQDRISVADSAIVRGDGVFEALRNYDGFLLGLELHLDRLERSAARLDLPLPSRQDLRGWAKHVAAEGRNGVVRILVTRGSAVPELDDPGRCIVLHHDMPHMPDTLTLRPTLAPWHAAGADWALAGAKTISYAPNMSAQRVAKADGFDDALLMGADRTVLEGPTFSIAWTVGDRFETPSLDLLILDSITRRYALELVAETDLMVEEGRFHLDRLDEADEVLAMSTGHEIRPVTAVGDRVFQAGPVVSDLQQRFREMVRKAQESE